MSTEEVTLVAIGLSLVFIALLVEIEHKVIWKRYKKNYHKHDNKFLDKLFKPYEWVYKANIYIVWPLLLVLGVYLVYQSI